MKSWSFSSYELYTKCPYRVKLKYVDRSPEPPREQATRGTDLHNLAQAWVRGEIEELHADLRSLTDELTRLKQLYAEGRVKIEEPWAWSSNFATQVDWKEAWVRMKLDFHVELSDTASLVVDYKSGKRDGKQIAHTEQGSLYAVGAYLRRPETKDVYVEFWYGDQKDSQKNHYNEEQLQAQLVRWLERGNKVTSGVYPPRANIYTCRYCPYRRAEDGGTGACQYAVVLVKPTRKKTSGFFSFGGN